MLPVLHCRMFPNEIVKEILSHLDPSALVVAGKIQSYNEGLWKGHCKKAGLYNLMSEDQTWRELWLITYGFLRIKFAEDMINKLSTKDDCTISEKEITCLLRSSVITLKKEPSLIETNGPVTMAGAIYGHFRNLNYIFDLGGRPPLRKWIFLGNYVDRGRSGVEVMCLLLAYKIRYPQQIHILRGNHECHSINRIYGFYDECKRKYNVKLWKGFTDVFTWLPIAALVNGNTLCVHGGISTELNGLEQIRNIQRPTDVPDSGLLCDLLWSDPDDMIEGWGEGDRGISFSFGKDVLRKCMAKLNIQTMCTAHRISEEGYTWFDDRFLTIFSNPNWMGEFDNTGAIANMDDNGHFIFHKYTLD